MTRIDELDINRRFPATLLTSEMLTPADHPEELRHLVLKIDSDQRFEVGQNVAVRVPGPHAFGNKEHVRFYSIAGCNESKDETSLSICVKRCSYIDDVNGERYQGVASNYLCNLKPGAKIELSGPFPGPFKLPQDTGANLLWIGMGTGIAPFRLMAQRMYASGKKWTGQVRLFYGARTGLELVYMNDRKNDFASYFDEATFKAFAVLSPRPHFNEPIALGEAIEKNAAEVWNLLNQPNTYVYIAGVERVLKQLDGVLSKLAGSDKKWQQLRAEMAAQDRWAELLY